MSAICGAVSLNGKKIGAKECSILKSAFSDCVIDRWEEIKEDDIYMGCGIQYFTKEAVSEQLPIKAQEFFFDADVILDNRKALLKRLHFEEQDAVTDGRLLYLMLQKYGESCQNDLLGAYAAVWYDRRKKEVTVLADAVGYRYVYYLIRDDVFYYSSLMRPLEELCGELKINDRWVADYIGQDNLNAFTEAEETPVLGIYRTAPAGFLKITQKDIKKRCYWQPYQKKKKTVYKSDKEYKKHFLDLYRECTACLLRSPGETAVLLSGGYDSTSVACLAAKELEKCGKKLYSFTSVPFHGYEPDLGKGYITDETELVQKTADVVENLECTFMNMPEMNCWYDRKKYMRISEIPYKSPQNMLWIYEGMRQAYEKNARIMLGGMFGNGTVSFDNAMVYLAWLFRRGRWITLYREVCGINKKLHFTKKSVLQTAVKDSFHKKVKKADREALFGKSFVRRDYLKKNGSDKRLLRLDKKIQKCSYSHKAYQQAFLTADTLRHYGEYLQKNSLFTGVIMRDPTRDKRMIEFVTSLPYGQFTHNGVRRRLIAEYMKDIVPAHILKEKGMGRQSADLKQRLLPFSSQIEEEWKENYKKFSGSTCIDCKKALTGLEEKGIKDMTDFEIVRHIFTNILLEYLEAKKSYNVDRRVD